MRFWNDVEIPKGPAHARLGGRPKSGIGPSFEPPDQSDEPRRVPEFQAADQMTDFNDTNSIMRGNMSVQSDPNRQLAARNAASMAMRSSFSDADRRMARNQEQQKAARDEYLLNLFRRADQNCTHQVEPAQQDAWGGQGPGMTGRSPQQLVGQAPARPSSNLPGYLAHGPLPVHGNPSSAGSQEPHKVDAAGSGAIQSMLPSAGSVLNPAKVKSKIGKQTYAAVRQKILEHMEAFVENIYDLHRLTRRQHHLESICDNKEAYAAELQELMSPLGVQEEAATRGAPEKADEAGKGKKETEVSDERKGSNEPILPVEEVLATALSSNSHPDCPVEPGAAGQPGADPDNDATGAAGNLDDNGMSLRQTSVQDLEMQHQNMAAAQEQMKQSMAAAHQAQEQQQRSMELAAQQQHQHHQSMAAAYGQSAGQQGVSQTPFQSAPAQEQCAGATQPMRPHGSQKDLNGGMQAVGTQQQNSIQMQRSLSNAMPNQQQPDEQLDMAEMQQGQLGTPRNSLPPYINPYQSFPNPGTMQNNTGGFSGYGGFNQAFYPGFNSFNNSNGQGYNAYTMMGTGGLSFDPMFAWYAHHYGRGAAQAQAQAQAQQAADNMQAEEDAAAAKKEPAKAPAASEQEGGGAARASRGPSASEALPVHWWQDPQAAFGAAVPADARQRDHGLSASAGRPARPTSVQPASREQAEWIPPKQRMKQRHSADRSGMVEATGQTSGGKMAANKSTTFGSGGSAFRKVAQRPWGFRALQRADSVGSETSRSKSSIGAASGRRHTDAASPPEQLQSAANILAGLSGQRPPS